MSLREKLSEEQTVDIIAQHFQIKSVEVTWHDENSHFKLTKVIVRKGQVEQEQHQREALLKLVYEVREIKQVDV